MTGRARRAVALAVTAALASSSGCAFAVDHPAAAAGIAGATLGFTTCKLASDSYGSCALVGGGAGAFLALVAATAIWLGGDGHTVLLEEQAKPLPDDGRPIKRRRRPPAEAPSDAAPGAIAPAPAADAPATPATTVPMPVPTSPAPTPPAQAPTPAPAPSAPAASPPAASSPSLSPAASSPSLSPAASSPSLSPSASSPSLSPAASSPPLSPAASSPPPTPAR